MSTEPRLIIFDVDGTLSDSLGDIHGSMTDAFTTEGLVAPDRDAVMGIIGLSLDEAMPRLSPDLPGETCTRLVAAYKAAYQQRRLAAGAAHSPLFPGMADLVAQLGAEPATLLAVATGKSRRGLEALLDNHGLRESFHSVQVADDHPSKPHPSMVLTALAETGVEPARAVVVGDTSYDIDMARSAGVRSVAVGWGYHPVHQLAHADATVHTPGELARAIDLLTGGTL